MRWRPVIFTIIVGFVVLSWGTPALAKGPDQATITGPGLDSPIIVSGYGEPGSAGDLGGLADGSGLFLVMFGESGTGQHLDSAQPAGELGPKYEIAYRVPDGTSTGSTVRQDLYPTATGGPVTYTAAGQSVFGTTTVGGWYRAPGTFIGVLQGLGVPASPGPVMPRANPAATQPQAAPADETVPSSTPWLPITVASLVVLLAVVAGVLFTRRRASAVAGRPELG